MDGLKLPEYSIPKDLQDVLDQKVDASSLSTRARDFSRVLTTLRNADHVDISENHYLLLLKLALYLEEYNSMGDMIKNKLSNRKVERFTSKKVEEQKRLKLFQIGVGHTIEDKLFIKPGDYVDLISPSECNNKVYTLRVTDITQTHIIAIDEDAKLHETFKPIRKYQIQFRFDNYYMRCAHFALWLIRKRNSLTYLFPLKSKPIVKDVTVCFNDFKTFNTAIESNIEQKQAVLNIINRSCFPVPYILYGPTGTGKTTTLVEAICQLYHYFPDRNILVCAPFDSGADKITKMLLKFIPPKDIYRFYNQYRNSIDEDIQDCANYMEGEITCPKYEDVKKRIVITTLCDCMSLLLIGLGASYFSHVIINEVGRALENEVLIPVSLVSEGGKLLSQIVLAGDPQQLKPNVKSEIAKRILGRSILERLMSYEIYQKNSNNKYNSKYITKLFKHYRSHPDIIHVSNKWFYDNELIPKCERKANEKFPVIFFGVEGKEKEAYPNCIYNIKELNVVMNYIDDLLDNRLGIGKVAMEDIGIITPFAFQSKKIQKELKFEEKKSIKVGTVDLFLNDERKIIIMTTTKSKMLAKNGSDHIEILSDARRFNIAMTRAKDLLIVVGNPNVLQLDGKWRYLIKYCLENKSYDGVKFSLDNKSIDKQIAPKTSVIVNSSKLFDAYVLTLFTIDDYNPNISQQEAEDSSLHSLYKNIVNPVGSSYLSDDKIDKTDDETDDNAVSKKASDQVEPNPRDIAKSVENLDVNEFICMDTSKNNCEIQETAVENDMFKNVSHPSIIENSLDELNNRLKDDVSQIVNNSVHPNLGDSSNFQKASDRQALFESDNSIRNESHFNDKEFLNSYDVKTSRDQQNNSAVVKVSQSNSVYYAENTDTEGKNVIRNSLIEDVGHFDYANSANLWFAASPTATMTDQKNLIDFDCVIKNDDPFNLIEFEDISKDSDEVPRKSDVFESVYESLL